MCHVLISGTFFFFNLGGNIGLVMVILNIQLFPLFPYLTHVTLGIEKYALWLLNTKMLLDFSDFSYEESQIAYRIN